MKRYTGLIIIILLLTVSLIYAIPQNVVTIQNGVDNEIIAIVDTQIHIDYGMAYPLTYQFNIPIASSDLSAYIKYSKEQNWIQLQEKISVDFYNAIELVRFDYINYKAFASVGFSSETDSIFIKIINNSAESVVLSFEKICKYYDNRDAAVTCSADDMAGWSKNKFSKTIHILRSFKIWVTLGINTNGCNSSTYNFIKTELDSGYVEAGAHSRTHPGMPYPDYDSEITGCKNDIINNIDLPPLFRNGNKEYVYTWIAPNGSTNNIVDSLLGVNKYLTNRLYYSGFDGFSIWNDEHGYYENFGVTRAFDPPRSRLGWGIGSDDIEDLNGAFDDVVSRESVYHVMCHPNVVEWDRSYPWDHLDYISNRKNIWYVSLGHVFLYHLAQDNYIVETSVELAEHEIPKDFSLHQNYPNPFNPQTTISYDLVETDHVQLKIYNQLGQLIESLVDKKQQSGQHSINWDASEQTSGIYIYQIQVGDQQENKKMILTK